MSVVGLGHDERVAVIDRVNIEKGNGLGVSSSLAEGIAPATILQKMQCGSCG
jgi:hypothetical protein